MKHILTAALSAAFLLSCSNLKKDNEPNEPVVTKERIDALKKKQADYCQWSKERYQYRGYVHSKCDGLLFTSLHSIACEYVNIDPFQKSSGLWKRSPTHDCFSTGGSRTGVSGDMLYGVLLHAWQYDRTDIIADLIDYGEANDWDMCGGEHESETWRIGRCVVKPGLKSTIYLVGNALGLPCDKKCRLARSVPLAWNPHAKDFEAHLVQLSFLLRGLAEGALNDNQIAQLYP